MAEPLHLMRVFNMLRPLGAKVRGIQMLPLLITVLLTVTGLAAVFTIAAATRKAYAALGAIGRELAALDAPRPVVYRTRPVRAAATRRAVRRVAAAQLAAA